MEQGRREMMVLVCLFFPRRWKTGIYVYIYILEYFYKNHLRGEVENVGESGRM